MGSFDTEGAIAGGMTGATTGATVGGPWGAAIGGGLGLLGGGFMGGDDSAGGSIGSTNPGSAFLELIFGVRPTVSSDGSIRLTPISDTRRARLEGAGIFGPDQLQQIRDFMTPLGLNELEMASPEIAAQAQQNLADQQQFFNEFLQPSLEELTTTGFLTDIDPVQRAAQRRFDRETLPGLREQFAGQVGTFGTDFLNSVVNAGADMQIELGALETELQEAASSRRAQGLPVAQNLFERNVALPITTAGDLFQLGSGFRGAQESVRPGGRVLDLFSSLSGMGSPGQQGSFYQGFLPSNSTSQLAALSQGVPQFAAALGDLWGQLDQPDDNPNGSWGVG